MSQRKRRKPTQTDKAVYMNFGLQGKFNVPDLMDDYETLDYNNLPDSQAENMNERDAARTLDLLVKYKGNVPAQLWNEAVRERELGAPANIGDSQMAFTADEMELSGESNSSSDDEGSRLSTKVPQRIEWARYAVIDLVKMPSITFCNTLRVDSDTEITLESMVGKKRKPDAWYVHMQKSLRAQYRNVVQLGGTGHTVAHFQLDNHFIGLLLSPEGSLLNYFHLNAVINEI